MQELYLSPAVVFCFHILKTFQTLASGILVISLMYLSLNVIFIFNGEELSRFIPKNKDYLKAACIGFLTSILLILIIPNERELITMITIDYINSNGLDYSTIDIAGITRKILDTLRLSR